jgi:hypothetical protein
MEIHRLCGFRDPVVWEEKLINVVSADGVLQKLASTPTTFPILLDGVMTGVYVGGKRQNPIHIYSLG